MNEQQGGRYTLRSLLEQYEVHIPQLQRDYAQGRKGEEALREAFVTHLYETLKAGKRLNLDFVYGYIKEGVYYPLDGQQRLTTLWLLHWYLVPAGECEGAKEWLGKFCYQTRITAARFCRELVASIDKLRGDNVVGALKNMPWFRRAWELEPTVAAMLEMLREIERQFKADRTELWSRLTCEAERPSITFDSIDIRSAEFRLTDELYIKMNARGKQLTPFESYKAHLTEVLRDVEGTYEVKSMSYEEYFSLSADNQWLDLFWGQDSSKEVDERKVDARMLHFYTTIARLCFFRQPQEDGKFVERPSDQFYAFEAYNVFRQKRNADFLFKTLDLFCEIKNTPQGIDGFFTELSQGITLFDGNGGNLFSAVCEEKPDVRTQILFLFVLEYMLKYEVRECNTSLRDLVRVLRNLLERKRKWRQPSYNTSVRMNRTGLYWSAWSPLLGQKEVYEALSSLSSEDEAIRHECRKAALVRKYPECKKSLQRLEEYPLLRGITDNFEVKDIDQWAANLPQWVSAFEEIWKLSATGKDYLIAQALIACGFGGRWLVNVNSNENEAWFMGRGEKWDIILTAKDEGTCRIAVPLQKLLSEYLKEVGSLNERLEHIIAAYWENATTRNWRYYFCKYPAILKDSAAYFSFSLRKENIWDVRNLARLSAQPTRGRHCNTYAYVVGARLGNAVIIDYDKGKQDNVDLKLLNSVSIRAVDEGWKLDWGEDVPIKKEDRDAIYAQFGIGADEHILRETPERERIEIAVAFCRAILALP